MVRLKNAATDLDVGFWARVVVNISIQSGTLMRKKDRKKRNSRSREKNKFYRKYTNKITYYKGSYLMSKMKFMKTKICLELFDLIETNQILLSAGFYKMREISEQVQSAGQTTINFKED